VLLTSTFSSVISSRSVALDVKEPIMIDVSIDTVDISKNQADLFISEKRQDFGEDSLSQLNTVINLIKQIFKDNGNILNICQRANVLLQILPDSVCHLIYWFIVSPISMILLNIWYNHPDYLIQYYAYFLYEMLIEIYSYFCDWSPTLALSLRSAYGFSHNKKCPCDLIE
jgi:hypothetical protein